MSGPEELIEKPAPSAGISCAKCEHLNPRGRNVCDACGAHLHIVCHRCGHRNKRARPRCEQCNQKLHRSVLKRAYRGLFGKDPKLSLAQVVLLSLAIAIGILMIKYLAELDFTQAEP